MKLLKILQVTAIFTLIGWAGSGASPAQAGEPEAAVQQLIHTLKKIHHKKPLTAEQKKANNALSRTALEFLDVRKVSEKALGKHWKKRSSDEQKAFVTLLGNLFKVVAFPNSSKFFGELDIHYGLVEKEGGTATVPLTVTHAEEGEVGLDFVMEQNSERWRVVDVVLDGVSMRGNLRLQFYKVLKKNDFAELTRRMEKKLTEEQN